MRLLSTIAIFSLLIGPAQAQEPVRHPVIGDKPARELLNSDLLALPDRERQAWVHGAVTMMAQTVAKDQPELSGCLSDWFTGDHNGQQRVKEVMELHPSTQATATVYAVARFGCDGL
ncbi:hypothetical protein [Parvularcula marina]|uniref:DUF732 domain-containing protein n=1 Tax=Parvularcula marina TaxID=2292771 RepID=A0A371RL95_9PROT|nr:hypothetical protein [Parvularcula marina]RFB06217.1 hypothetical protein DX908_13645 [Parvularcula marina]